MRREMRCILSSKSLSGLPRLFSTLKADSSKAAPLFVSLCFSFSTPCTATRIVSSYCASGAGHRTPRTSHPARKLINLDAEKSASRQQTSRPMSYLAMAQASPTHNMPLELHVHLSQRQPAGAALEEPRRLHHAPHNDAGYRGICRRVGQVGVPRETPSTPSAIDNRGGRREHEKREPGRREAPCRCVDQGLKPRARFNLHGF